MAFTEVFCGASDKHIVITDCHIFGNHFANLKPKSVIRPKQGNYQDIIASFQLLSAFLSASCFHLRFDIARYAFSADCRNLLETNTNKIKNLMTDLG